MKKILPAIGLILAYGSPIFAQYSAPTKPKGKHSINFSFTPQWYLNKVGGIKHTGVDWGQRVLYPKNTLGYTLDLEYQRVTSDGLVFSLGLQAAGQKHDVGLHYNAGFADKEVPELKTVVIDADYAFTVRSVAIRAMVGYNWNEPLGFKGWDLMAKGGITARHYTNYFYDYTRWRVGYPKGSTLYVFKRIGDDSPYFGSQAPLGSGFNYAADIYLGLNKNVKWKFVRSLSIGLEATIMLHGRSGTVYESLIEFDNFSGEVINGAEYRYAPKDLALGVRFTIGLWP